VGDVTTVGVQTLTNKTLSYGTSFGIGAAQQTIDFNGTPFQTLYISTPISISTLNRGAGKTVTVRLENFIATAAYPILFDPDIVFVGPLPPAALIENKIALLSLVSFGSKESDTVAAITMER
jgi:hypothetical protein